MDDAPSLTIDITATARDQIAGIEHLARQPWAIRLRRRREVTMLLLSPSALLAGGAVAWLLDDRKPEPLGLIGYIVLHQGGFLGGAALTVMTVMALCLGLSRIQVRRRTAALVRRALKSRADIDPSDPALTHHTRATFDAEGVTSETPLGHSLVRWRAIQRMDETADYLFLISGPLTDYIVPKRVLAPGQLEPLRALIQRNLAAAHAPAPPAPR